MTGNVTPFPATADEQVLREMEHSFLNTVALRTLELHSPHALEIAKDLNKAITDAFAQAHSTLKQEKPHV